jgi:hypothetical protein
MFEIYTLNDPQTLQARYVGVTHQGGKVRLRRHLNAAKRGRTYCANWIRSLVRLGLRPFYRVIEYGQGGGWAERERFWIVEYRGFCDLTNLTEGGEGALGHVPTKETRAKMSASQKGRSPSLETRAKLSAASKGNTTFLGRTHSVEARAKMSAAKLGKRASPETRAKMSAAQKGNASFLGKTHSVETRARMSVAKKGHPVSLETRAKISAARRRLAKRGAENQD